MIIGMWQSLESWSRLILEWSIRLWQAMAGPLQGRGFQLSLVRIIFNCTSFSVCVMLMFALHRLYQ